MYRKKLMFMFASLLFSVTVYAGFVQPAPVVIEVDAAGNGIALGDMISARNSENEFEFIGCGIRAADDGAGGAFYSGFCQASVEEEGSVTCFTQNVDLLEGINILSDSSFITFSWTDDGSGNLTCVRVGSSTQSFYLPEGKSNLGEVEETDDD